MDVLRAPWRMSYINESGAGKGCFFCDYASDDNDDENLVIARGRHAFVVMNRYPYSTGHLMVVPYKHTAELSDLLPEEASEMLALAAESLRVLRSVMRAEGFNMGVNIGRAAGAGVDTHIHLHIVPRWNGDTNFMTVTAETKVLPEALSKTYSRLRGEWTMPVL